MKTTLTFLLSLFLVSPVVAQDQLAERLPEILQTVNAQMVRVEGGSFTMGCTPEQENCDDDEKPTHLVQINSFEIGKYEVTQELWEAVMGDNPSAFADCPQCPVETVSWDDIQAFLAKLNAGGGQYRLPSEAEWEYASRGGQQSKGFQYAGSNDWAAVPWYYENTDNRTHPVGQKQANELGLFDMSGNVREWVQDCYHDSYDGAPTEVQIHRCRAFQWQRVATDQHGQARWYSVGLYLVSRACAALQAGPGSVRNGGAASRFGAAFHPDGRGASPRPWGG